MANNAMENWLKQAQSRKPAEEQKQNDPMQNWLKQAQSRKPVQTPETAAPAVPSVYKSSTWSPTVPMAARSAAMEDVNAIFAEKQKQEQQAKQERQAQQETMQALQKERAEVELTQTRANRSGGVKDKEAQKALKTREKELEAAIQQGQEALGQQTTAERLGKAGQSIALNIAGSVPLIAETAEQALENTVAYENSELDQKFENALNDVKLAKALHGEDSREYQMASGYLNYLREEAMNFKQTQPGVSKDSLGYQMLDMGQKAREKSLEGLTGSKRLLAEQALSLADNAAVMPLGLINPVLPGVVMGAKVNAGKIYDLTNQGVNATSALARGTVSGAIEAATEKMGVDNLFDVVKTGGKTALVNILKQAGVEGTEEGFSYLFNWMADKAAKDPNATFSPAELLANIAGGAVSGLVFGAGGTAINRLGGGKANTMPTYSENGVIKRPIRQTGKALQAPAQNSLHLEAAEEVDTNALHLQAIDLDERIGQLETTLEIAEARAMLNDAETGEQDKARVAVVQRQLQNARKEYRKVLSKLQEQGERQPSASQETANALADIDNTLQRVDNEIKRIQEEGGVNLEGASLSDESAQRNDGAGAGEQTGSVGAGAGETGQGGQQRQADAQGRATEARNLADALQVTAQSSRSLGLVRGTDDATVRMIPREQRTAYMTEVADKVRQETGREVDFYVGELRVRSNNQRGYTVANGCILPDGRIYVQADNDTLTAEQIAMHEAAHDLIDQNRGMMAQTIQQVQERYGNEALEAMVDDYLRNLRGLDMDANSCMEEILCDAFAGINAFDAQADVLQEDVQRSFAEYRNKDSQQEQGAVSQRGPPVQQATEAERPRAAETATRTRETNVTRDEETSETERPAETLSAAEKARRELLDALNAGEITEEDFDAAWADIMSEPEMQDRERLSVTEQDERVREQTERYQRGEITADELRGYLNGMQAGQANKNTAREGGVERYSISELPDGTKYVRADRQVIFGNDPESWSEQLEDYINGKIRRGENVQLLAEDGDILTLTADSAGKIASRYDGKGRSLSDSYFETKVNAGAHIDELVRISKRGKNKQDYGKRHGEMAEHGWNYRTAFFQDFDGKYYMLTISVAMGKDGNAVYNIGDIKERTHPDVNGSSAKSGAQNGKRPSKENVPQTEEDVNPQTYKSLPVKERLSVTEPVERTKDLLAIHNKDWNYIRDAVLDWGGIPSPSVAIVDAQEGHTKYGDTSVIYPSSAIDPQLDERNKVYGSDAWTPTHSSALVEYEVDYDVKQAFDRRVEDLSKNVANGVFARNSVLESSGVDDVTTKTTKEIAQQLASNYEAIQAAYLAERGKDVPVVYREKVFDSYGNDVLKVFVDQVGVQELANMAVRMELGERLTTQEVEAAREVIVNDWVNKNEWRLKQKPELRKNRIDKRREQIGDIRAEDFIRHAWEFYENTGATSDEVDKLATADNLRQAVNVKDVEAWVEQQLQGLLGKPGIYNNKDVFDSRGNRRSFAETHWDYTAENIVRAMNNASDRGEGLWGMSGSGLVAMATPEYGSIEAIHGDESRLRQVEKTEYDQMVQDLDAELDQVTGDIMRTTEHHTDNSFEERDIIGHVIAEAAGKKQTVRNVKAVFAKNGYAITDQQAANVINLLEHAGKIPAGYFEAKPKRVVGFDEALAVIAPSYVPIEELDAVRNAGVNVLLYEAGNDQQRMEIANSLEGAKFSVTENADNKEKYSFAGTEAATADLEKLEIAKGLEQNGVAAEQIRWETGWYRGADNQWRHEIDDSGMRLKITEDIPNYTRLGELIDHPALFAAYPDMQNMDVTFHRLNEGNRGKYNRTFDSIELNYDLKSDPETLQEVLVHEIQHALQNRENFASGASASYWNGKLKKGYDSRPQSVRDEEAKLQQEYSKVKEQQPEFVAAMERLEAMTPTVPRGEINWDTLEPIEEDPIEWQQFDAARDALEEQYGSNAVYNFLGLQRKLQQLQNKDRRNALELYYDTAGEIEARNAADRQALTQEERRQRRPDTGRGRAVFAEDAAAYAANEDDGEIKLETVAEEEHRKMLDGLTTKERNYLQRVERRAVNQIAKALGVPYHAKREYLMPMVQELATEYMTAGEISEGTKNAVFEKAWDEGIEVDNEFYNAYKPLKDRLRNTAVMLAERDRADIPDWNNARKNMFGVLRIVNEGGMTVDQFYEELASDYPGMFPTDIRHPADRLQRMYEVGRDIRVANLGLEQYYGPNAERYKAFARGEFENNLGEVLAEMRNVKRSAAERAEREQITVPETPAEIMELYKTMKNSRREYEKVNAKQLLSDTDRELLNRAMRGEVDLDNVVDDGRYNLKGVKAVYDAKQVYEQQARVIRDYNRKRKAGLRNQADTFLKNAGSWKDKRAGILYSRETQERNVYDIVKNKAEAKALIAGYFAPVHRHEAAATKMKNELRDKVRALNLSRKVQKGNLVSEAHAVQLLGEAEDNIRMLKNNKRMNTRDGKTLQEWEAIVENLWKESPKLDQQKIRNGVQAFREMYDDLFQQMNEVRVRNGYEPINFRSGYFPHFQAEADGILAAFGKALGIDTAVEALPTSINGLTRNFKPGIRWVGNTLERLGFDTTYDAVEGFDRYIEGVADVIHHTDDIQKLRALSAQVRYRTTDEGIRERVDQIRADSTLADQDKENRIREIYANGRFELGNYAVNLDEYTNLLANKKSESDRNMERQIGRHMYKLTKTLEGRVAANMVAVNPASWLTNFIPITQGGAQLGPTQMLHGMWNTLVSMKSDDGVVSRSSFLTNRQGSDSLVLSRGQTWSATASAPMGWIDNFTAGSLVRARYEQNLKRGLSEQAALEEADEWAAGVMADRSKGSMPTLFHASNPLTKLFTQFQLEVNNQLSYLFKDIPREELEKGIGHLALALMKFFVGAWLYNEVYEYFIGRRPALDPIGILNEFSGDLTGWEVPNMVELGVGAVKGDLPEFRHEKAGTYEAVTGLLGNTAEELPFIGGLLGGGRVPIQSALPDAENLGKVLLSDDWSREKKWATAGKELLKPAAYLAPPFGGGQLKKAIEGINAWRNNGSYTVNAKGEQQLQYPIFNDTLVQSAANLAQAAIFGKTTLKTGRDWIENDFKTFSVNETAAYNAMVETGMGGEDAYSLLLDLRAAKKTETESAEKHKQRVLLESDAPADAKAALYYAMFATEDEQLMMNGILARQGNGGAVAETLIRMKLCETSNDKRRVLMDSGLADWEKKRVYQEKISDTRDEDIELFKQAGMDMDDFLEVQNKYTEINGGEGVKAGDKALALSRWLNGQNYSAAQKDTIKEVFKFFSQIPAEAAKYDSFTAMGMNDDEAFRLTDELSALKPEEGKTQVSNLQKWKTVVSTGLSTDKQLAALGEVMSETEYLKLNISNGYGIEPQTYVKFKEALQTHDANGNGSYNQDEIRAAIDALSGADEETAFMAMLLGESVDAVFLTTEQKAVLWQLQSSSNSAKNNPYSRSVGEKVLQLKNAEDSPVAEGEAALLAMLGLN